MHNMYWVTAEFLFDREQGLFYRDENYFYQRSKNGIKVFWSRGNGWGMGSENQAFDDMDLTPWTN